MEKAKIGDVVEAKGIKSVIDRIMYQDHYKGDWDIEFIDINNVYRHWKSCFDGGSLVSA